EMTPKAAYGDGRYDFKPRRVKLQQSHSDFSFKIPSDQHPTPEEVGDRTQGDGNAIGKEQHGAFPLSGNGRQGVWTADHEDFVDNLEELEEMVVPAAAVQYH